MSFDLDSNDEFVSPDGQNAQCARCWRPIPDGADHCPSCRLDLNGAGGYDVFHGRQPSSVFGDVFGDVLAEVREAA